MKICIVGTGFVGLVTGTCLADLGNQVDCVDIDPVKIEYLRQGRIPIFEPGLQELVEKNASAGRLRFSTDIFGAVQEANIVMICVGTPSTEDGEVDLQYVYSSAEQIADALNDYKIIVTKSTVPVGTNERIRELIFKRTDGRIPFDVASVPEFMREGNAIQDFFEADRVIIGTDNHTVAKVLEELHLPLQSPLLSVNISSAEMIKYAANSFLAMKISFINEIANICEIVGSDVRQVAKGIGMDSRIGPKFLSPGIGFGGSCFPKDTRGLLKIAEHYGYYSQTLHAVVRVNEAQKIRVVEKLMRRFPDLNQKSIAVLGLAFKPNTDDMREAPSIAIISELQARGARVRGYDPVATDQAKRLLDIEYAQNPYDCIRGADAVLLLTEWEEFKLLDWKLCASLMNHPVLLDGRNHLDAETMVELGFDYEGMGIPCEQFTQYKMGNIAR